jgi:hypothetical protein
VALRRALTGSHEGEDSMTDKTPRDAMAELVTCLDVLAEYVDATPSYDADVYNSEFLTACWQTVELTFQLIREYQELVYLMQQAVEEHEKASKASKLVIGSMADMRALREGK